MMIFDRRKMGFWSIWIGMHQQGKEAIDISSSALHEGTKCSYKCLIWCQLL
ncbi:hypothetical protein QUC31_002155 [Theobroma cacao]